MVWLLDTRKWRAFNHRSQAAMKGKGELYFGSLGDVMKESIRAAMSVVRARGESCS
jgi:ATP-dependent Lon protease